MTNHDHDHDTPQHLPDGTPYFEGPDGLRELDHPMPRWMALVLVGTIVWGAGYLVLMPGMGLNLLHWGQYSHYDHEVAEAKAALPKAPTAAALMASVLNDHEALERGEATFKSNCAACHGQSGEGAIGPSFKDATWLYGGAPEAIVHTITEGTAKGMPAFKTVLGDTQRAEVAAYVHHLGSK
jgi:cytochrome c oxidase cbb3-type subunit 3